MKRPQALITGARRTAIRLSPGWVDDGLEMGTAALRT